MTDAIGVRMLQRRAPAPVSVIVAAVFLAVLAVAALAPGLLTPIDPLQANAADSLQAPGLAHPFGTDQSGRDVLARVIHGARYSLSVGLGATALGFVAGLLVGVASGLAPRIVDSVLGRIIAIAMSFPEFLLALIVIAIIGPGQSSLVVALSIATAPAYARVARSQALLVRRSGFVRSARVLGVAPGAIILKHVVPNTLGPLLAMATIGVGTAIVSAAGLSFLGLGPAAPTPEWGVILSEGRNLLDRAWWVALFPGVVVTATVLSISVVGRFLRAGHAGMFA